MAEQDINWSEEFVGTDTPPANQASEPASEAIDWEKEFSEEGSFVPSIGQPSVQSTPESKYAEGYLTSYGDVNTYKAESQGFWDSLGNRLASFVPEVMVGTVEMLGYMTDMENVAGAVTSYETDFDNWLSAGMREVEGWLEDQFPVYSRNPGKDKQILKAC